jgi:hypothetical protein
LGHRRLQRVEGAGTYWLTYMPEISRATAANVFTSEIDERFIIVAPTPGGESLAHFQGAVKGAGWERRNG